MLCDVKAVSTHNPRLKRGYEHQQTFTSQIRILKDNSRISN